ncbi:MAG: phenylalanine--tRNA ligase subunit beta [Candidatus Peribacteraceae bacterium]|nr:phenylalanine--tRNA ligase subunit beta [Candidatus Peribacteraceae bacterium]
MKISLNWLADFVDWIEKDPEEIARQITACTAEVDAVHQQGALLDHCCAGKVLTVSKHPNADKLSLCDVETDKGKKRVVCGGTNLREGMCVAFAHIGARVRWHGTEMMTLEKTKIRGEESEGMICAAEELGLEVQFPDATGHQIIDLGDRAKGVGEPLRKYLGLSDTVLDIDNHAITQRPDLFSHVGFARECVAMGLAKWKKEPSSKIPAFAKEASPFKIKNDAGDLIPRYCACTLSISGMGETPDWMKARLEATGWRSLNLPVDITNYVTMELGMPLHSFDCGDLKGDVHMRTAKKGEKVRTLDDTERVLPEGAIVLSDDAGIFDLLGIMGGLRSSTKETTRTVLLHSAIVDPVSIRNTIIATGHRTDAATIYEKGIPPVRAEEGFYRALQLFLELVPGARITSKLESWGKNGTAPSIPLRMDHLARKLGTDIPKKRVQQILTDLGCSVSTKKDALSVRPPLWRIGDLKGEHDLVEEVGRIYGYDAITPVIPTAEITPPNRDQRVHTIRDILKESGGIEITTLSFTGPALLRRCRMEMADCVEVENALGEEYSLMQPSTLPALLSHAGENLRHVTETLKTFTVRHVFRSRDEWTELGFLVTSRRAMGMKADPFLVARADLALACAEAGYAISLMPSEKLSLFAHPGRSADVLVNGAHVGVLFEVHPAVCAEFDLPHRSAAALLDVRTLLSIKPTSRTSRPVPEFPAVVYDVTFPMAFSRVAQELLTKARSASPLLEGIEVADLYSEGGQKYNLTVRCTYRSGERTLTEEEVKREHEKVLAVLQ